PARARHAGSTYAGARVVHLRSGARARVRRRAEQHRPSATSPSRGAAHLQRGRRDRPADDGRRRLRGGALADLAAWTRTGAHARVVRDRRRRCVLVLVAHHALTSSAKIERRAYRTLLRRALDEDPTFYRPDLVVELPQE